MVYDGSPLRQLSGLARLMAAKLKTNNRCFYLHRPDMVAEFESSLAAAGVDVRKEVQKGSLILSSDRNHLINGRFSVDRMLGMLANAVDHALADGYQAFWASGDMTWELGEERNFPKLLEYEWALEDLFERQPALHGVCQYHADTLPTHVVLQGLRVHRSRYISDELPKENPYYVPPQLLAWEAANPSNGRLKEMLLDLQNALDS